MSNGVKVVEGDCALSQFKCLFERMLFVLAPTEAEVVQVGPSEARVGARILRIEVDGLLIVNRAGFAGGSNS